MAKLRQTIQLAICIAGSAGSFTHSAQAQCGELTFLEAIEQALAANHALAASRNTLDAQQKEVAIARSSMLPQLTGSGKGIISSGATFSASDPLPDPLGPHSAVQRPASMTKLAGPT